MNTILEAMQQHPEQFISTCRARANSTSSPENKVTHLSVAMFIAMEEWDRVRHIISSGEYYRPLEGVVFCLTTVDSNVWQEIVKLFEEGKIV